VFVELTEFSTRGKSPVLKEPAPANVLDELLGDKISESPIWTMEPVPMLSIFICPTIAGIVLTPLRMDTLLPHYMTVFAQRCSLGKVSLQSEGTYTVANEVVCMSEINPQPWKWENFEKLFGQKLPLLEKGKSMMDNMAWVENFIQDTLKKAMPKLDPGVFSDALEKSEFDVFETHDHVIVQVKPHKEENPRALQVFIKSDHVKLTGFLKGGSKIIKLPTLVAPRTAKARYKEPTLQIQISKRGRKESYHETYIRF
jgi:hypothetical protein